MDINLTVADPDVPDVLAALETRWKSADYDTLTSDEDRLTALLVGVITNYTRNVRRERQERALPEPTTPDVRRRVR